jgi:hypothetical protein
MSSLQTIYIHSSQSNEIHLIKDNCKGLHQKLTMPQKKWYDLRMDLRYNKYVKFILLKFELIE